MKRRKHKTGHKPNRKGTLKINLQPVDFDYSNIWDKIENALAVRGIKLEIADTESGPARYEAEQTYLKIRKQIINEFPDVVLMDRAWEFLVLNRHYAADLSELAAAAITEAPPEYNINDVLPSICRSCEHFKTCKLLQVDMDRRSISCTKLFQASTRGALDGKPVQLTAIDMAELAVKHLS